MQNFDGTGCEREDDLAQWAERHAQPPGPSVLPGTRAGRVSAVVRKGRHRGEAPSTCAGRARVVLGPDMPMAGQCAAKGMAQRPRHLPHQTNSGSGAPLAHSTSPLLRRQMGSSGRPRRGRWGGSDAVQAKTRSRPWGHRAHCLKRRERGGRGQVPARFSPLHLTRRPSASYCPSTLVFATKARRFSLRPVRPPSAIFDPSPMALRPLQAPCLFQHTFLALGNTFQPECRNGRTRCVTAVWQYPKTTWPSLLVDHAANVPLVWTAAGAGKRDVVRLMVRTAPESLCVECLWARPRYIYPRTSLVQESRPP